MLQVIDAIVSNPEDDTQVQRLNFCVSIPFLLLQKLSFLVCRNGTTLSLLSEILEVGAVSFCSRVS